MNDSIERTLAKLRRIDPRGVGALGLGLAGLAGIFQESAFYSTWVFMSPLLTRGGGLTAVSRPILLALVAIGATLVAVGVGLAGSWQLWRRRPSGGLLLMALALGIVGEVLLGFVGLGDYSFTGGVLPNPTFWIVVLLLGEAVVWGSRAGADSTLYTGL